jgi:hypothetical protein
MPSPTGKPHKIRGIKSQLEAISFRYNRLWSCVDGAMLTCVNGEWMNEKEFDERYPIPNPVNFYMASENSDKTKEYLK